MYYSKDDFFLLQSKLLLFITVKITSFYYSKDNFFLQFINTLIMSLPPEKVAELKQVIQSHLNQLDIHGQMRNVLSESLRQNNVDGTHDQDKSMIQILKNHGIVDDIMKTLKFNSNEGKKESDRAWLPDERNKCKKLVYFCLLLS